VELKVAEVFPNAVRSLHRVGWKELAMWSLMLLLFTGFFDTLTFLLNRHSALQMMVDVYKTAYFTPLLWFAFVIVGPLMEEIVFRGFMFKGIEHSKMGPAGAVIITSLVWSFIHIQYDVYGMVNLFFRRTASWVCSGKEQFHLSARYYAYTPEYNSDY